MKKIVYYVASSLDGFIAGPNDDVSNFMFQGEGIDQYREDLKSFDTVIMGRTTYEIGYKFGLQPGQPGYPNMEHYIFSNTLVFDNPHESVHVEKPTLDKIHELKQGDGTDIYLCGGGLFAGWLLENGLIDTVILKLNPIILGDGVKLFGNAKTTANLILENQKTYDDGLQIITYAVK